MRIYAGSRRLIGMITEVETQGASGAALPDTAIASVDVMGEIVQDAQGRDHFRRGVSAYPAIGDAAGVATRQDLRQIYEGDADSATIGALHNDEAIPARISISDMLNKHFAVLGSTGVGKSSGVAVILNAVIDAAPNVRIFLLDGHNEFARCFGARANVVNPQNLKLPFWLFNFEEFVDVVYGGRPAVEEELEILAEHIPIAKGMYLAQRAAQSDRFGLRKVDPRRAGYTVDTPVPYLLDRSRQSHRRAHGQARKPRDAHALPPPDRPPRSFAQRSRVTASCSRTPMSAATRWPKSSPTCSAWSRTASRSR